jgi:hypothetical protein
MNLFPVIFKAWRLVLLTIKIPTCLVLFRYVHRRNYAWFSFRSELKHVLSDWHISKYNASGGSGEEAQGAARACNGVFSCNHQNMSVGSR